VRALSLRGPGQVEVIEAPDPAPGEGEVVVRVRACGVCGSDMNAWRGVPGIGYPMPPGAPGHEVTGEVVRVGHGLAEPRPGQVVTGLMWNGFAEFVVARADHVVVVPPGLEQFDVLGEPLACAANVIRRAGFNAGDRVALVGFGYLAVLISYLLPAGVSGWVALSRRADSRALSLQLGAEATYDFANVPNELWDGFPVVIEAAGVQQTLDVATWLTAYGGRLIVAGYHANGPRMVNMQSWNWKGIDVINAHERDPSMLVRCLREALQELGGRAGETSSLHTHAWSLEAAAAAFRTADERPSGFVKGVVRP
jgi:threonine dehydrogenase-like Zn-dependent dehydrogenase